MATLKPTSIPAKRLSATISGSSSSFTLQDIKKWPDNTGVAADLSASDFGTLAYGAFTNPERTKLELFAFDPSTIASASISFVYRGLPISGDYDSEVSSNKQVWLKNETVVLLGNDVPQLLAHYIDDVNDQTIAGVKTFSSYPVLPGSSPTTSTQAASKGYVDGVAIAGAPNADTSTKGIVEVATTAEALAGTATGGTGASLVVTPDVLQAILQGQASTFFTEDGTGADDTYTATVTPSLTAYTTGQAFRGKFTIANTGACTVNINSLGAKSIKKYVSGSSTKAELETGDIVANQTCFIVYDGTDFVLLNPSATMPTTALLSEMATFFSNTDITGAEAESLTDNSTLTAKHYHKKTAGGVVCGSGTQTIAHGLGVTPKRILIHAFNRSTQYTVISHGVFDGSTYSTAYVGVGLGGAMINNVNTAAIIYLPYDASGGTTAKATAAIDATNITLTWTNGLTSACLFWEAEL